ncbi:LysR family transcriptional regulator [Variovorax paradoxus]|jgi:DNA-binding transcriptional LysR family regulator|uniref:LysR family transcriptional regulator n=1 Tax=Variovorax TaxID=34072 RepID=UPI0006E719A1|nr:MULTISPECIES: LysR family transcriptional regulator [unclassified Variovorax]KPU97464.1 LysR family transcriptional regulator [Variovorax paradoxus]KPV01189.1 LysR family transcriptional regulator [Variovorax paradoxus]KPV04450.1 LysR family transcriptional regulator [Variovorax paradoxus]KPV18873.1 LysR family transcriptional regulator [Variovorax paradoxus]KPV30317.1 LysR family transcriptional regulator [Variovorax paradoxus]
MSFSSDSVEVFLAVIDHGSFSAAARALRRVPSAVSMAIAHLEAELDLQLFDRKGREPRPTAAARSLEPQARALAAQLRQLDAQALALTQGLEERLTLAIAPELLAAPWSGALAELAHEYPLLQVEVLAAPQADALALLHSGRAQLALVFERPSLDGREGFQEVGSDTMVAVMAPGHPVLAAAPGGRLREEHLIATRQIVVAGRDLVATMDPRSVFARHLWRTDNALAALSLITAGVGWGWLPRNFVRPHVAAGALVEIPLENLSNGLNLWVDVVWSRERPLGLGAQRFVALISRERVAAKSMGVD